MSGPNHGSRGPCNFRQRDVTAAVKAAQAAGLSIAGVEITKDGTIRIIRGKSVDDLEGATDLKGAIDAWQP